MVGAVLGKTCLVTPLPSPLAQLGDIVTKYPAYHSERCIYPVGYRAIRFYRQGPSSARWF